MEIEKFCLRLLKEKKRKNYVNNKNFNFLLIGKDSVCIEIRSILYAFIFYSFLEKYKVLEEYKNECCNARYRKSENYKINNFYEFYMFLQIIFPSFQTINIRDLLASSFIYSHTVQPKLWEQLFYSYPFYLRDLRLKYYNKIISPFLY